MFCAVGLLGEGFPTKEAFKGSYPCVDSLVFNEGGLM
jgi:hypothetical protein